MTKWHALFKKQMTKSDGYIIIIITRHYHKQLT